MVFYEVVEGVFGFGFFRKRFGDLVIGKAGEGWGTFQKRVGMLVRYLNSDAVSEMYYTLVIFPNGYWKEEKVCHSFVIIAKIFGRFKNF